MLDTPRGAATFAVTGDAYDAFMGRYSRPLAEAFAGFAGVAPGQRVLDVGCGPGALTSVLVRRTGAGGVAAVDPSASFVEACRDRLPGVDVHAATAERLPFGDGGFDAALSQLVLHFVDDAAVVIAEMSRVTKPGATVALAVWDAAGGMQMLRAFWDAAAAADPGFRPAVSDLRYGGAGEISRLMTAGGLDDVREETLRVTAAYRDFDELWGSFGHGIGPAGGHLASRTVEEAAAIREQMRRRVGSPAGGFTLGATARAARGTVTAR